ncbi:sporulation protein SsgA [Aurantiacibacter spongiae]|uniref:Sporulation protein SsgA n=2 Tax=Aurantiacibacter spongiae TaxID=2488860 RepID=A0A3N5DNU2_9SPHN|nr:sporulation protein SsgA [Aurantiacibacter spongiae]
MERTPGALARPANGPRSDYPITVGDPYTVAGTTFTPVDALNYDEVGYLAAEAETLGITGAHHTLPVPSYVEVTSLETGRTVLARIERRGPMASTHLLALSPAAMDQLGAAPGGPVRVRRVNPPEEQRAMLRAGDAAPLRMDTPMSLVEVLRRRLPESGPATPSAGDRASRADETAAPTAIATVSVEPSAAAGEAGGPTPPAEPPPAGEALSERGPAPPVTSGGEGAFRVQVAAFSTRERAANAAAALGGEVVPSGRYFLLQTGPFATHAEADASLAKVRRAGYSDARILTSG